MKKTLLCGVLALLLAPLAVQAQYLRSSYFMDGSSTRMQLNPALQPRRGYINLPVIGSLTAEVSSSSLGYQDVIDIFDSDGEFYNNDKFYHRLKDMNTLNVNVHTDLISFGFYKGKGFWSFNVGARVDVDASIPKSMFDYLRATDVDDFSWDGQTYHIVDEKVRLNAYTEIGTGYSRAINSRLTVGGKVKLLLGAGNIDLKVNELYIYGKEDGVNSEFKIESDAKMKASVRGLDLEKDDNEYITDVDYNSFGIGGYGAGIDLGASYRLLNNLTLSASILDLGFISWSKSSTQVASSDRSTVVDKDNLEDITDVLDFNLYGMKQDENQSRSSSLSPTLVLGGEYSICNNRLGLGLLSTTRFGQLKNYSELTFSANYRPNTLINTTLSYSMIQGGETFGLAVKVGPVMVGTDYMFLGKDTKHVNAFVGVSIPLTKKRNQL